MHRLYLPTIERSLVASVVAMTILSSCGIYSNPPEMFIGRLQGEMVGEVTATSAILQSRLTAMQLDENGDAPGKSGIGQFEVSTDSLFQNASFTPWLRAEASSDFIIKTRVENLASNTRYWYRLHWGEDERYTETGPAGSFTTLPGPEIEAETRFVVVTGMHYGRFRQSDRGNQPDAALGYPALVTILDREPHFFVGTGDNVYYDHLPPVTTIEGMRKKWREQFVQQRYIDLFSRVPTYWEKDDHDLRYDDCDSTDTPKDPEVVLELPAFDDGIRLFLEQVPIVDPSDENPVTYRTHRVSSLLQIWFLEGRDYRSPNLTPDGPDKTMWGVEQRTWLQRTLLESDAPFKVIISPTPMVGPDDLRKKDNHTNIGGFRHEGDAFFQWALENDFLDKGLYIVCGDRHWQYHSIHPLGFEEFSSGALVDGNSRLGVRPGDANGTDPEALINQPFTSPEPSGGFLEVRVTPSSAQDPASITFDFFDENGLSLYTATRQAYRLD